MARQIRAVTLLLAAVVLVHATGAQLVPAPPPMDSYDSGSDNKLLCMAEMVSSIENSCSQSDIQGLYVALEALLKQYLSKCFHTNFTQNRALHEIMPDINENVTGWLREQADTFKGLVNLEDIVPTFVPPQQVNAEVELMMQSNLANSYDGWLLDPYVYGLVSKYSGFYPLDDFVNDPNLGLQWDDVLPFVRNMHSSFKGQIVAMPLDVRVDLLFYRKDLLERINATAPPVSWAELLQMVRKLNGTDMNGDGKPDYGICIDVRSDCGDQINNVMAIAASILQYTGTNQGVFFDPTAIPSGAPSAVLVNNPGFQAALATYVNLTAFAPPLSPTDACSTPYHSTDLFAQGRCAFIMGSRIFKNVAPKASPVVAGNIGVTQLPGSSFVLDRTTNTTVPCTPLMCPYATPDVNGTLINHTPWSGDGGWVLSVNRRSTSNYLNITVAFHAYITQPNQSWNYVTDPTFEFEPYRLSHLTNVSRWAAAGYNANDTKQWLDALYTAMDVVGSNGAPGLGNNMAMDLRVPVTKYVRNLYNFAITNATLGVPLSNVTTTLATAVAKVLQDSQNVQASLAEIVDSYYATIKYQIPPPPPMPPAPPGLLNNPDVAKSGSPSWLPIAIILPVIGALLLVATGVMYEVRNKRKHKDLFGNVLPPRPAPDTCILYMEIQSLEEISAAISGDTLGSSLGTYAETVRSALHKHSGYESSYDPATGAFTIAFHSPKDALLAGLDVQAALLSVSWPAELVALTQCAPVHVLALSGDANESNLNEILDANETQLYTAARTPARGKLNWFARTFARRKDSGSASADAADNNDFRLMGNLGAAPAGPTIPALVHVPTSQTYSFATACQNAWKEVAATESNKVLIFKGLRVRMGIHAGVNNPEFVVESKDDKHKKTQYIGQPVQLATAIARTAQGGMLLLSEDTYKKLPLERLWDRYLVIHVGEHNNLEAASGTTNLYHALNRTLEGRLAHLSQVETANQLDTGVLDAPVGCVTVAFMHVVGAQTLLSWNADIAQSALKLFHSVVGEELKARHGYLVEAVDGLFLAAFLKPLNAVLWALECNDLMLKQSWPDELLMHELCEELVISSPTREGDVLNTVVFRGPRLKTGVDTGQVLGEVHAMTGRMTYRGKVMNRAARIASTASTGQVLCSADSWELMQSRDLGALLASKITSSSLGQFRLKGVAERIEIYHCRKPQTGQRANRRGNSMVVNITDHKNRWNWESLQNQAADRQAARPDAVSPAGIDVDLALPASLDKDGAGAEGDHDLEEALDARGLAPETEDEDPVDDEDDDEVDEDEEILAGDPYVLTPPPMVPGGQQDPEYTIAAARNSRASHQP